MLPLNTMCPGYFTLYVIQEATANLDGARSGSVDFGFRIFGQRDFFFLEPDRDLIAAQNRTF